MYNQKDEKTHITKGLFFEMKITSRYVNLMGIQAFEKLNMDISFEEYLILDVLTYNEGICQRDLAKMLLRDRSNVGKIIASLEKMGLLKIKPAIRNKRTIRKLFLTKKGKILSDNIYEKIEPFMNIINEIVNQEEQEVIIKLLKKIREVINDIVETKI